MIVLSTIIAHTTINFVIPNTYSDIVIAIVSVINPSVTGTIGVIVAFRYRRSRIFQRSYTALGIGYLANTVGEILYLIYDNLLNEIQFPSVADVFFLSFYPLVITHLLLNIRFFAPARPRAPNLIWLVLLPTTLVLFFFNVESPYETATAFVASISYVALTSTSLVLTIYAVIIFKEGLIGKTWMILLIGFLSFSVGDVWYSYLEVEQSYSLQHPVNVFWYAGYWIIFYALYKHTKII
jgi:hypothetical protein